MEERTVQRSQFLGKWVGVLFWMFIPSVVAGIMTLDIIKASVPAVYTAGSILQFICELVYFGILFYIGRENEHYRAAGIAGLIAVAGTTIPAAVMAAGDLIYSSGLAVISLIGAGVALVGEYQEYMGHADVLKGVDDELSEKWRKLWTKYIILTLITIGCAFIMFISFTLGSIITIGAAIGLVVVSIMKLVYLNKTSNLLKAYQGSETYGEAEPVVLEEPAVAPVVAEETNIENTEE